MWCKFLYFLVVMKIVEKMCLIFDLLSLILVIVDFNKLMFVVGFLVSNVIVLLNEMIDDSRGCLFL